MENVVYQVTMEKWLDIPKDRTRLPVGRLCLIMALTILLLLSHYGREATEMADAGLVAFGLA
jgi:hypothetical protein